MAPPSSSPAHAYLGLTLIPYHHNVSSKFDKFVCGGAKRSLKIMLGSVAGIGTDWRFVVSGVNRAGQQLG